MHLKRFGCRPLSENTTEFSSLRAHFEQENESKTLKVLRIDKVFNFTLEQRYKEQVQKVLSAHGSQCCEEPIPFLFSKDSIGHSLGLGETLLYHGCRSEVLDIILENGFEVPHTPRSGCFFGKGIYFTDDSKKADAYVSKTEEEGSMLVAKVLLGRTYVEKEKPRVSGIDTNEWDSLVSYKAPKGLLRHNEYVVYDAAQCVPLYVVRYTKVSASPEKADSDGARKRQ